MNAGQVFDTDGPNSVPAGPLGNFKVAIPITYLVDEATDVDDLDYSPGKLSIREAILLANGDGAPSVINFKASAFPGGTTVSLNSGEMKISQPVDINGPGRAQPQARRSDDEPGIQHRRRRLDA